MHLKKCPKNIIYIINKGGQAARLIFEPSAKIAKLFVIQR
jgi:hypothetical protein